MKVFISADMEGVTGVVSWDHVSRENPEYERHRLTMTLEVNAAIEGAFDGGATEVTVNDSHDTMKNLLLEEIHPEARVITGSPKPSSMCQGLDESFGAVFLTGCHARAGTPGVLSHTYTQDVAELRFNGMVFGEIAMNAAFAGAVGVPVALVVGDSAAAEEAIGALGHLGPVQALAVKRHVTRFSADHTHPSRSRQLIREAARRAVLGASRISPFLVEGPVGVEIRFINPGLADAASLMPGVTRLDALTVACQALDCLTALRAARAMIVLASRN
ncbi:MAG: M55 family metallopeptidase [Bacillota bacterium]